MSSVEFFYTDDSEGEENVYEMAVKRRQLRDTSNPLELPNNLFIQYFRINKEAFSFMLSIVENKLEKSTRYGSVSPIIKLAAVLRFFAQGSYQTGTGNEFVVGLAQSTFSKVLSQICLILEKELCPQFIKFPTTDAEKERIKLSFYEKFGFPGVIGCVDGTHIKIITPLKSQKHLYINRKGFYSLNVMIVCDDKQQITYVDSNHPGSCHDSFIFNSSDLDTELKINYENGQMNTWLLGDAGYALKPYIITPFRTTAADSQERRFNTKHSKARNIVERTIGLLKNRFRCLLGARQLHYSPQKAAQIINVCCALHNLCISHNVDMEIQETTIQDNIEDSNDPVEGENSRFDDVGQRVRAQLMNSIC